MIFVNDLHLNLANSCCILFADNTTIYMSHSNLRYLEFCDKEDIENISDWFKANQLTLNLSKTVGMVFSNNKNMGTPSICIDSYQIPFVDSTKFLGVWIDKGLSWTTHVSNLLLKIKRNEYMLKESKHMLTNDCLRLIYFAQIQSHLSYGISIWVQ